MQASGSASEGLRELESRLGGNWVRSDDGDGVDEVSSRLQVAAF
jgi:hypothetical protein